MCMLQKSAIKPMQTQQGYSSAAPYAGPGAPSSMYIGVPPYGSSLFNGSSMPPYDVGSAYPYNYGTRGGSPFRPMQLSAPSPYSGGSMIGNAVLVCVILYLISFFIYLQMGMASVCYYCLSSLDFQLRELATRVMFSFCIIM